MIAPLQPQFSLEHQPAPASGIVPAQQTDLLSTSFDSFQVTTPATHSNAIRNRKNAPGGSRTSRRRKESASVDVSSSAHPASIRRIRPLAIATSNANMDSNITTGEIMEGAEQGQGLKVDACATQVTTQCPDPTWIEFPPKHVVLHPDDVNNKIFIAMGRAFMSVNNRAMTVKDLAELSMKHGLVCQNPSAAAQAITSFIRTHLQRCEDEDDFPLLFRLVLQGSTKDDDLAPALYSRSGGNVTSKEKMTQDENGNLVERATCFRRGTTVWYLSPAAGAPNPFARAGIALRDYADVSAITGAECRKPDMDQNRKRKRDRPRRHASSSIDEDDEGRKPQKIKLTLRLRPCLTSIREKSHSDGESSSSGSESDSEAAEPMDVEPTEEKQKGSDEPSWSFPPFPITRRISIPPYTPSDDYDPSIYYTSSTHWSPTTGFECPRPKLGLFCVDSPRHRPRSTSLAPSIASPPPDSDDENNFGDDDEEYASLSMSPVVTVKREDPSLNWDQPTPSSSGQQVRIKTEPGLEEADLFADFQEHTSTQTIKPEEFDAGFNFDALNMSINEVSNGLCSPTIKQEDEFFSLDNGYSWGQPVDLTLDDPVCEPAVIRPEHQPASSEGPVQILWNNIELLGPESIDLRDFDREWDAQPSDTQIKLDSEFGAGPSRLSPLRSVSPTLTCEGSVSSTPSYIEPGPVWSAFSPDTEIESAGPASPPCIGDVEEPTPMVHGHDSHSAMEPEESMDIEQSETCLVLPKKQSSPSQRRRQVDTSRLKIGEATTPWERGMYTEADKERILPPESSLEADYAKLLSSLEAPELKSEPIHIPLSPQEEEVFRSLCVCPSDEPVSEPRNPIQVQESESHESSTSLQDVTNGNMPLQSCQSRTRSAQRRSSKRIEQARVAKRETSLESNDTVGGKTLLKEPRTKESVVVEVETAAATKLRRSKRVAAATPTTWNRERLRKRT